MSTQDPIYVAGIQKAINEKAGQKLVTDGSFGPKSVAALKLCQFKLELEPTGVYDQATQDVLDPFIRKKYITMDSLAGAADMLGVTTAHVRAVCDVEAGGSGFLPDGRVDILFERHHFYNALSKKLNQNQLNLLTKNEANLVNKSPGGYYGNEAEYKRFARAMVIDRASAIYATSFGMFQIMGFNYQFAGYQSLEEFYDSMLESEVNHLTAFVRFNMKYRSGILQRSLKVNDWTSYASNYNGPNYAKNQYDKKLADSFAKYKKNINAA